MVCDAPLWCVTFRVWVASWLELAPRIVWRSVHIGVPWPRALTLRMVPPLSVTGSCEDGVSCSQVLTTCLIPQVQTKKEEPLPPASSQSIPTFYFPQGRPQGTVNVDAVIAKIERTFAQFPHERATMEDMGKVAKVGAPRAASGQHHVHGLVLMFCFQDLKHSGDSVLTVVPNIEDRHACALLPSQMEQRSPLHFLSN